MGRPRLSDELNRLLPGEQYKRIRAAILLAHNTSNGFSRSIRNQIDQDNRPRNGLLNAGTLTITSTTTAELDEYAWVINFEIFQPGFTEIAIEAPHPDVTRPDVFLGYFEVVGGENVAKIVYVAGTVDDEGNSQFPNIPDGHILLATVNRNPDGSNDVDPGSPDLSDFVSKSATAEQSIESDFRVKKQASQEGIPLPAVFDVNGRVRNWRKDRLNVYNSVGVNNRWNQICQVTKSVAGQVRFSFLYMATNSADEIVYVECFCYVNINSSGNLVGSSFNYYGELQNAEIKAVDAADNVGIFIRTNRSQNRHWVPIIANVASRITYNQLPPDLEALPAGDQYEFTAFGGGGIELDEDIVDGLEAALGDNPGTGNRFVTSSFLNSFGYIQEAAADGKTYGRLNEAWQELYILTSSLIAALEAASSPSGSNPFATIADLIPQLSADEIRNLLESLTADDRLDASAIKNLPSGGGGRDNDAVHYDADDLKNATEKRQARENIGLNSGFNQVVDTNANLGQITRTANLIDLTGATVTRLVDGITGGIDGEQITFRNRAVANYRFRTLITNPVEGMFDLKGLIFYDLLPNTDITFVYDGNINKWVFFDNIPNVYGRKDQQDTWSSGAIIEGFGNNLATQAPLIVKVTTVSTIASVLILRDSSNARIAYFTSGGRLVLEANRSSAANEATRRDEQRLYYQQNITTVGAINDRALDYRFTTYRFTAATSISGFASGEIGRTIDIDNASGATITLLHENTGSIAANRIKIIGSSDLVIPIDGKVTLKYCTGSRWELVSKNF